MAGRGQWTRESLVDGVRSGDRRALARAITLVENADPLAYELVRDLYPTTGQAYAIGVTGPPGVGKSSLIAALLAHVRALGPTAGVISIDPSSPFSQGALLGDRIRLADHFLDPGIFIRSMGTRGHLGGLAEAALQALLLLDAAGKDLVFVETVGTGQSEVEVVGVADTVLLVLMPGSGDSIQALKAGIMEIPDVIAINKMDHPAAKTMGSTTTASGSRRSCSRSPSAARTSRSSGRSSRSIVLISSATACSRSAAAGTSPARCSRSPPLARSSISSGPSTTIRSCGGCSTPCSGASSTRSRR